jgi:hypothetical protein
MKRIYGRGEHWQQGMNDGVMGWQTSCRDEKKKKQTITSK